MCGKIMDPATFPDYPNTEPFWGTKAKISSLNDLILSTNCIISEKNVAKDLPAIILRKKLNLMRKKLVELTLIKKLSRINAVL